MVDSFVFHDHKLLPTPHTARSANLELLHNYGHKAIGLPCVFNEI